MKLKSLFLLLMAVAVVLGGASCSLFGKSKQKKKEDAAIASGVESDFRRRWVERRAAELTGQGTDAATARGQADAEFREKYPYLKDEKK